MDWCHRATSNYLSQCWPRFMPPYVFTRSQWVNTINKMVYILQATFSNTFFERKDMHFGLNVIEPTGSIDRKPSLVQEMALCWPGNKPLPEPMITNSRHFASASMYTQNILTKLCDILVLGKVRCSLSSTINSCPASREMSVSHDTMVLEWKSISQKWPPCRNHRMDGITYFICLKMLGKLLEIKHVPVRQSERFPENYKNSFGNESINLKSPFLLNPWDKQWKHWP